MRQARSKRCQSVDVDRARTSPADEFERPDDVVTARGLTEDEKAKILNQWEVDAQGLSRASDEGMGGGEPTLLTEVQAARRKIVKDETGSAGTKDRRTSGKPQP
jgi:hypothetical protein